jgi:hypothetical protein
MSHAEAVKKLLQKKICSTFLKSLIIILRSQSQLERKSFNNQIMLEAKEKWNNYFKMDSKLLCQNDKVFIEIDSENPKVEYENSLKAVVVEKRNNILEGK